MPSITTERYQHIPLQNSSSIRVLKLLPGDPETPLYCEIAEVEHVENVSFEALSYAWVNDDFPEEVQIYEHVESKTTERAFPITRSLFEALNHLRSDSSRTLWVDALCVNQEDAEEKAIQVAHMGHVYRLATRVIVWLGEDKNYPRTKTLLSQDGKNRWPLTRPEADLAELMAIPWFTRVWPVLEYVLPQTVIFQLGLLSIPSQHLETVVTRTGTYLEREKNLEEQWKSIQLLFQYRKLVQERKPGQKDVRLTLARTFLDLTRSRLCKDSRDRIYGILGVFENISIVPDYTLPVRQVYQDFVSKHLRSGNFAILHECCIGIPNTDEQSYVPFFGQSRSPSRYIPFVDPFGTTYSAGLHLLPAVNVSDDNHISIQGFSIDTVHTKLDFAEDVKIDLDGLNISTQNPESNPKAPQCPLQGTWGAIYQTILAHLITDPTEQARWREDYVENPISPRFARAPYPHNSLFDVLVRAIRTDLNGDFDWLSSKGKIRPDAHLRRDRRDILAERSLFWTKQGFIGLGTCHMEPGDEVVVFAGDTTPFLLRKEGEMGEKEGVYKIVSDCYLYGWMHGTFPDRSVATDPSRRKSLAKKLKVGSSKQEIKPAPASRKFIIT